jgi:predicted O-methyltransferase YrrM
MTIEENQELKGYLDNRFSHEDSILKAIQSDSHEKGLPDICISPYMGKFIYLIAKIQDPHKILEIGTLGGYSTVWLARALKPGGKLISLEINPLHVQLARDHIQKAHLGHCVEIREGHGVELLAQIGQQKEGPFDLFFLDADKENNVIYFDWALSLSRPGSLILIDNIIPKGPKGGIPGNKEAISIYAFNDYLAAHPAIEVAPITTLVRGRLDGMAIVRVK